MPDLSDRFKATLRKDQGVALLPITAEKLATLENRPFGIWLRELQNHLGMICAYFKALADQRGEADLTAFAEKSIARAEPAEAPNENETVPRPTLEPEPSGIWQEFEKWLRATGKLMAALFAQLSVFLTKRDSLKAEQPALKTEAADQLHRDLARLELTKPTLASIVQQAIPFVFTHRFNGQDPLKLYYASLSPTLQQKFLDRVAEHEGADLNANGLTPEAHLLNNPRMRLALMTYMGLREELQWRTEDLAPHIELFDTLVKAHRQGAPAGRLADQVVAIHGLDNGIKNANNAIHTVFQNSGLTQTPEMRTVIENRFREFLVPIAQLEQASAARPIFNPTPFSLSLLGK